MHSVYSLDRFGSPHYSWFHGSETQIHLAELDPQFARLTFGHPLPKTGTHPSLLCNQMIEKIQSGTILPEYLLLTEEDEGRAVLDVCKLAIESLAKDGKPLYAFEKRFDGDLVPYDQGIGGPRNRDRLLYHLDLTNFTPF